MTIARLLDVAAYFRLDLQTAMAILRSVDTATSQWRAVAARNQLDEAQLRRLAPAFEHARREEAQRMLEGAARG